MDDDVRDTARRRLEGEARRVSELIEGVRVDIGEGASRDSTAELSSYDQHPADTGSETFEREKDFSILTRLEVELSGGRARTIVRGNLRDRRGHRQPNRP